MWILWYRRRIIERVRAMKSGPISWNRGRVSYHSMLKLISAPKWIILGRTHLEEPRLNTQHHLKFILKYWTRRRDEPLKYLLLRNCLFFPGTPPPTPLPLSSREAFDFRPMTDRPSVPHSTSYESFFSERNFCCSANYNSVWCPETTFLGLTFHLILLQTPNSTATYIYCCCVVDLSPATDATQHPAYYAHSKLRFRQQATSDGKFQGNGNGLMRENYC